MLFVVYGYYRVLPLACILIFLLGNFCMEKLTDGIFFDGVMWLILQYWFVSIWLVSDKGHILTQPWAQQCKLLNRGLWTKRKILCDLMMHNFFVENLFKRFPGEKGSPLFVDLSPYLTSVICYDFKLYVLTDFTCIAYIAAQRYKIV